MTAVKHHLRPFRYPRAISGRRHLRWSRSRSANRRCAAARAGGLALYRGSGFHRRDGILNLFCDRPATDALLILDGAGLAFFAVSGALKALAFGLTPPRRDPARGAVHRIGGGIARDVLVAEIPTVLRATFTRLPLSQVRPSWSLGAWSSCQRFSWRWRAQFCALDCASWRFVSAGTCRVLVESGLATPDELSSGDENRTSTKT